MCDSFCIAFTNIAFWILHKFHFKKCIVGIENVVKDFVLKNIYCFPADGVFIEIFEKYICVFGWEHFPSTRRVYIFVTIQTN